MVNKKGAVTATTIAIWALMFIIGGYILDDMGVIDLSSVTQTPEEIAAEEEAVVQDFLCPPGADPSNTMTVGPLKAKWSPTTSMDSYGSNVFKVSQKTDGTYDAFKASNDEGNKTNSGTLTIGGKDKIGIICGYESTSPGIINYYSRWVDFIAPCRPFSTGSYDSGRNELIQNASSGITVTIKNSDTGFVQDFAGTYNETIGAGEYGYFDFVQIQTAEKEGISAATDKDGKVGRAKITVEMNGTMYEEEKTTFGSLATSTVPSYYTVQNTDSKVRTFITNGCPDPNQESKKFCEEVWGRLAVKAESGVNPFGGGATCSASDIGLGQILVCIHDEEWYLNTNSGAPEFGFEKDDGTSVGKYGDTGQCWCLDVV